jgi:hypothetical protein
MVPLKVVVRHELSDRVSQHILTKQDDLIQTTLFDGSDEAFGVCIQIR